MLLNCTLILPSEPDLICQHILVVIIPIVCWVVAIHTGPNWSPSCFNSKFINKSNFTHPNAQELSVNFDQSYGTCWQFLWDASNFIAIYKGFHFGVEQLTTARPLCNVSLTVAS